MTGRASQMTSFARSPRRRATGASSTSRSRSIVETAAAQVEADGPRVRDLHEGAGEQVLSVVLLEVVAAAATVHTAVDTRAGSSGALQDVEDVRRPRR